MMIDNCHQILIQTFVFDQDAVGQPVVFVNHFVLEDMFFVEDYIVVLWECDGKQTEKGEKRVPEKWKNLFKGEAHLLYTLSYLRNCTISTSCITAPTVKFISVTS